MKLFFKYLSILFRSQMQYRTSFLLLSFGQFFVPFSVFAGLYFLFGRFGELGGWTFFEVALCFAVIHMSFSVSECFARGFDSFSSLVTTGEFDRLLVRPRNTVLQVLGSRFEFSRVGRLLMSVVVLLWACVKLETDWTVWKGITLVLMVISGVFVFTGIYMIAATICFWTIQGVELNNVLSNGGKEMAQYPLHIYEDWVKRFFTFVIPFGCVNYLPLMYVLDRAEGSEWLYALTPLGGMLFIIPCLLFWNFGVRRYRSTGS